MHTYQSVVDYSETESNVLGLKVGRCNSHRFEAAALHHQIVAERYDICRLKVPAEDEMATLRLHSIGAPAFFSGSIRRYKTRIIENSPGNYNYSDLQFELYDGTQDTLLREMIAGTWGTYPIGYYRTPYLGSLIDKEKEIDCLFRYYKLHNLNKTNAGNSILFIRQGDNYIGFFALNIVGNNLESHIGGILQPYRKGGYFLDKLRFIKDFCLKHQLEHFVFGARNENSEVQRIFQFVGFQPVGTDNVFHIASLLSYSQLKPVEFKIKLDSGNTIDLQQQLFAEVCAIAKKVLPAFSVSQFRTHGLSSLINSQATTIYCGFPVIHQNENLLTLFSAHPNSNFSGYLSFS